MQVQYLEIVTNDVESVCATYAQLYKVTFSAPVPKFGHARTAKMTQTAGVGYGMIGVRAPMYANETPIIRPYVLVEDIATAVKNAEAAGAKIIHPPLELPGQETFAIYSIGGVEHGLWQF